MEFLLLFELHKNIIMKFKLVFVLLFCAVIMHSQKAVFLHHSTGNGVWNGGKGVPQYIKEYNEKNGTNISVQELSYPSGTYPWENYPYDYWNLWINGACQQNVAERECLNNLCSKYKLIIFKHCFPGAGIQADNGNPNVKSAEKTLGNYKAQYRALLKLMDSFPYNKFLIWTLAPLHRNATSNAEAARAKEFVDWVNNTWLKEDGKSHPNIYIFDFFMHAAEQSLFPVLGNTWCLKYSYEGDHNGSDSHPNNAANDFIAPLFAESITKCFQNTSSTEDVGQDIIIYPVPVSDILTIENHENLSKEISVFDLNGKKIVDKIVDIEGQIDVSQLNSGVYFLKYINGNIAKTIKFIKI